MIELERHRKQLQGQWSVKSGCCPGNDGTDQAFSGAFRNETIEEGNTTEVYKTMTVMENIKLPFHNIIL